MHQIEVRKNNIVYTPCKSTDSFLGVEFQKGEISGIYTAIHIPEPIIEALQAELASRLENEENQEDA